MYECRTICNQCGVDLTNGNPGAHAAEYGHSYGNRNIQTGSIHHDATGHNETKTIVDREAYKETVTEGYKCSCEAVK